MIRIILYSGLTLLFLLLLFMAGQVVLLASLAWQLHPAAGWLVGFSLAAGLLLGTALAAFLLLAATGSTGISVKGGRTHRRYVAWLARRHRRYPAIPATGLPTDDSSFATAVYQRLEEPTNGLIAATAEAVFFHTAISQSGSLDALVSVAAQLKMVRQLARQYCPRPGVMLLLDAYLQVLRATLGPSGREETNPGAQIGPAIVGASVVGAIPGANLVSMIIADAVIQGSANALAIYRVGLVTRRYFQARLEGEAFLPDEARQAANQEAAPMLALLVSRASGVLSRAIWDAAKESLRRMPAATYDSLKSLVSRSVQGLGRKKDRPRETKDEPGQGVRRDE